MNCARRKEALLDAALGALPPAAHAELRVHLESCSACRAEFETQRLLVAAMDHGIGASVAAGPSPAFAAHAQARIAQEENSRRRGWFAAWMPLTASCALTVVAFLAVWLDVRGPVPQQTGPLAVGLSLPEVGPLPDVPIAQEFSVAAVRAVSQTLDVLVPPDQWTDVLRFYNTVRSDRVDAASLLAAPPAVSDVAIKPLEMPELKIAPLEIVRPESESRPAEPAPPVPRRSSEMGR